MWFVPCVRSTRKEVRSSIGEGPRPACVTGAEEPGGVGEGGTAGPLTPREAAWPCCGRERGASLQVRRLVVDNPGRR